MLLVFALFISTTLGQSADTLIVKSPKKAALWSIIPGGGQIYNGKYLKAGLLITLESLAIWQSIENGIEFNQTNDESFLNDRNQYAWWALFLHVYGTLDAVVDSHLKPFNEIMEEENDKESESIKDVNNGK
jgi:hypothetical protein